ncbi:uncharacterized protein LOC134679613 [Cydia fagiglandana]|uniref:uncharacterized protein LOC134679613 n=1 Tax=Cydia fagiglandana TaxID=1458189 RepID=UPI002FEDFA42
MKVHTLIIVLAVTIVNCAYSWWDSEFIIVYPTEILRTDHQGLRNSFQKLSRAKREMKRDLETSKYVLGRVKQDLQSIRLSFTRDFAKMEQKLHECSRIEVDSSAANKKPPAYEYPDTPDYDYNY